jgi:ketosteroid isomerase-like protein
MENHTDKREFVTKYWSSLETGDLEAFAPLVAENCVVHYPGNHFLSGKPTLNGSGKRALALSGLRHPRSVVRIARRVARRRRGTNAKML